MRTTTYTVGQRWVAYILLVSFFLQSCYNPYSIQPNSEKKEEATNIIKIDLSPRIVSESHSTLVDSEVPNVLAEKAKQSVVQGKFDHQPSIKTLTQLGQSVSVSKTKKKNSISIPMSKKYTMVQAPSLETDRQLGASQEKINPVHRLRLLTQEAPAIIERQGMVHGGINHTLSNQIFQAKEGYKVRFEQKGTGEGVAKVEEYFPGGMYRSVLLPIYLAPGIDLTTLEKHRENVSWQKSHIHVVLNKLEKNKSVVYVGKLGLAGGIKKESDNKDEKVEKEGKKEAKQEEQSNLYKEPTKPEKRKKSSEDGQPDMHNDSKALLKKLSDIHNDVITPEASLVTWSTGENINNFLTDVLGIKVHVVNPDLASIHSPADDSNRGEDLEGAINYSKEIEAIISNSTNKKLDRPIVMILNTQSVGTVAKSDTTKEGGLHWQTCVILPKHYITLSSNTKLDNKQEILFYVDSTDPDKEAPALLIDFLKEGVKYTVETDTVIHSTGKNEKHETINPIFPGLIIKDKLGVKQQVEDGSNCGWWAVYNALMIVYTGGIGYLDVFKQLSTLQKQTIANKLRTLMPSLCKKHEANSKKVNKEIKKPQSYKVVKYTTGTHHQSIDPRLITLTPDGLKSSLHGDLYQLGLLTLAAIRAHNNGKSFYLVSEAKECEKFDDLVIDYGDSITFLQAKHSSKDPKEDGYTKNDFCAAPAGEASLAKYFDSWLRLKKDKLNKQTKDTTKKGGGDKATRFIFFTNRHIKDEKAYLEQVTLPADEFLFKGLETKNLRFKQGESRSDFIDAIRAHSEEVRNYQVDKKEIKLNLLTKELQEATKYLQKKCQEKVVEFNVDGRSKLSKKEIALIGLVKTDQSVKEAIVDTNEQQFKEWIATAKIEVNIQGAYEVLTAPMEEEIQQFLNEFVIKVEQPSVSPLIQLLKDEFKLNSKLGGEELFHAMLNKMFEWLCDRETCLMKSSKFNELIAVGKGDLQRFYLLGNTKTYEQEYEGYPMDLDGLEVKELANFLAPNNKRTIAVVNDHGSGGVKARVYCTIKKFRDEQAAKKDPVQDGEWAFISVNSKYFKELADVLKAKSTKFIVVDCMSRDRLPEEIKKILPIAKENNKKLVFLVNPLTNKELSSLLSEKNKDEYEELNLPALTYEQINKVCEQHANKFLAIGGKYLPLSSILESENSGLYKQVTNIDSLHAIIKSLVEAPKGKQDSGLPYDMYVENDLMQGIPCYGLSYLLQTVNSRLFVIEGVKKDEIDKWLKQEFKDKYASGSSNGSKDTRYRLVDDLTRDSGQQEKFIYISNGEEIKHDAYVQLKLINQEEYEFIVGSRSKQIELPPPSRYDFSENKPYGKDMKIKHGGSSFLKAQQPEFSILTAHAGLGKSAFCFSQRATWRNSKEEGLPFWLVRINLPQLELPDQPSLCDAFTFNSTYENWPNWKLEALEYDMKTLGRVFLLLDGFDEIKNEKTVQSLNNWMTKLNPNTNVLITTRPYAANKIVPHNTYTNLRCMTLKEYNEEQHKNYISKYLDILFQEIFHENSLLKSEKYELGLLTGKVYEKLKSLISKSAAHLLGIPLETYIFCEALRPYIKDHWLKERKEKKDIELLEIEPIFAGLRHLNAATLYEHFILSKLQMFFQKHMLMSLSTTLSLKHRIYTLAASYLEVIMAFAFKQAFGLIYGMLSSMLKKTHYTAEMIPELQDTGLVEVLTHNHEYILKFNHETYQEYFAALYLLKSLAEGEGSRYQEAEKKIIEHCYIPKYRMIMIMAAQLSLSNNPAIPAWSQNNEEQVRRFWEILASAGDVLGAASYKLLKDCLQGLSPEQIEKLSVIIKSYKWGDQVLNYIEKIKKEDDDKEEIRENDAQEIDIPFDNECIILQEKKEIIHEQEKLALKKLFEDKSKVVAATKDALATIRQADIAKVFDEIVDSKTGLPNHYWDIDGGFQAMALLGNYFNRNHANFFVERIENDASWRATPALAAVRPLLAKNLTGEAKIACMHILACLARQNEAIADSRELSFMLKTFFEPIMNVLIEKLHAELSIETIHANIEKLEWDQITKDFTLSKSMLRRSVYYFISMLNIAYKTGYAVVPSEDYRKIKFIGDNQINFECKITPLMEVSQNIIKGIFDAYLKIASSRERKDSFLKKWEDESLNTLDEECEKKILVIALKEGKFFEKCFEKCFENGKHDGSYLCSFYQKLEKYDLLTEQHVAEFVKELNHKDSAARMKHCYWSINGGIQTTQYCWKYFNQDIADYLIFRAGCWNDNALEVVNVLQEIKKCLLKNPINDKMHETAIAAYNHVASEVNKYPYNWLKDTKVELIDFSQPPVAEKSKIKKPIEEKIEASTDKEAIIPVIKKTKVQGMEQQDMEQ